ncbi:kti12, chromatin associated [Naganishia albida]|nr:kti12, chromatin associated [Naganishia albida]
MAFITISGYPCSGKSTRARQIKADFERRLQEEAYSGPKLSVEIVDDPVSKVTRESYDNSLAEKPARASLFTNVQRSLGEDKIVICDAPNYIKGFRYQMYCAAREAKVRVATVFVVAPPQKCREWHDARAPEDRYKQETFDNLIMRFEEPSSMARWDSPLFAISWDDDLEGANKSILDDLWVAATQGAKKGPTAAVVTTVKPPPNALQTLTKVTTLLVTSIQSQIGMNPSSSTVALPTTAFSTDSPTPSQTPLKISLPTSKTITLSELQRLKRQFETIQRKALSTNGQTGVGSRWGERDVAEAFARYLEEVWGTSSNRR